MEIIPKTKLKISFDFDSTLSTHAIQSYAKKLIARGFDVWIVTSRYNTETHIKQFSGNYPHYANKDLYKIAEELGIPKDHIYFTNMACKYHFFKDKDFIWHLDDDKIENEEINEYTSTKSINPYEKNWINECEKLIK